jgi:hypothetical protein
MKRKKRVMAGRKKGLTGLSPAPKKHRKQQVLKVFKASSR